jgi:hypothetical protein
MEQVERLAGVDRAACQSVLDDLVRAGFLGRWLDGSYSRSTDASASTAPPDPLVQQ